MSIFSFMIHQLIRKVHTTFRVDGLYNDFLQGGNLPSPRKVGTTFRVDGLGQVPARAREAPHPIGVNPRHTEPRILQGDDHSALKAAIRIKRGGPERTTLARVPPDQKAGPRGPLRCCHRRENGGYPRQECKCPVSLLRHRIRCKLVLLRLMSLRTKRPRETPWDSWAKQ